MIATLVPSSLIVIWGPQIDQVEKHIYIGHKLKITRANQTAELTRSVILGWAAYGKLGDLFKTNMIIDLKSRDFNRYVLSIFTHGAKILTLTRISLTKL